jgi:hypothetical protein
MQTRFLRPRWLTVVLILWAAVRLAAPSPASAGPLPPRAAGEWGGGAEAGALEGRVLRGVLAAHGLSDDEARALLARLTPAERAELAARVDELATGRGTGFLLVIVAILLVAVLLYLPMAGRMEGWWQ